MDWLTNFIWHGGHFLGIEWHFWKVIGWVGNVVFTSRFVVQWYVSEKKKQVVVPATFWWLSLAGSWLLLAYALYRHDSVFIFANLFNWIPYIRNLVLQRRHLAAHVDCDGCGKKNAPQSNYCPNCGAKLAETPA